MARAPRIVGIDENERFLARVAWAYHVEGLTQGAVAERLGVTRLRVNKALSEARRMGLVRITLNTSYAPCIEAEEGLKARYGLRDAVIAPQPLLSEDTQTVVGVALGHLLTDVLADPAVTRFGMSWGNTLNIATRHLDRLDRPDLEILSVMGGTTRGSDVSSFEITSRLAALCNARHFFFPAPLYAGTKSSRDTIVGQAVFTDILERIRRVDALTMAVGDMSERSLLMRDALPADVSIEALLDAGAVGDLLGTVLDASGQAIDHPINERLIGIDFADLAAIPNVILAAGGAHKVAIIRAVLSLGLVDTFVSDEATARALLEPAPQMERA
ncbi:transcriptional regulator [Acuticoccus sp. M5D2P5]|uniref:sugar-binding transcriptional regulator n=1 Tax=Acuticoccus kalidii TaxID=2910977 RepID=UPI001F354D70|nr:sugar-binding domain-containing protein [Acuticoccus kalidii]MCF3932432.1 transcriptional regulator [Acuticoccus kalidii]